MLRKKNRNIVNQVEFVSIEGLVPEDHLLRAIEKSINFDFIYEEVKELYSENNGRPSIDPVILIKLLMLQVIYGIKSMRQTIKEVEVNIAYRWFLGYGLQEKIPHFSTFGKNYERRFKESDLFEKIFVRILMEAIECGFIAADAVFIDATHIKASANKNKYIKKMAQPMTKDGYFCKKDYVYDEYYDCYICPNNQVLEYTTTNRNGYREYKSNPEICKESSMRLKCTQSKNYTKVVTMHIWEEYTEIAEDIRPTNWGKELYKKRGETIERVFADAKEKHGMRYTHLRGLRKVSHYLTLLFACMNLKKLALWKKKQGTLPPVVPAFSLFFSKFQKLFAQKENPAFCIAA